MTFTIAELLGILAFVIALAIAWITSKKPITQNGGVDLRKVMTDLSAELVRSSEKIRDLEHSNSKLELRIASLEEKLQSAEKELIITRAKLAEALSRVDSDSANPVPIKPLLVILGTDSAINDRDRHALRRARINYQRLADANQKSIVAELRRRREEGSLYPWLHISAHGGDGGILLSDGIAGPDFWHENLTDIQIVFLASCSSSTTADELAGLADWVIYFQEGVGNQDASDFTYSFWLRVGQGTPPPRAYQAAIEAVPSVAEFVDIRRRPQVIK